MEWTGFSAVELKVAVVGLGYVGLPLALQFAKNKIIVYGIDLDKTKCDILSSGKSYLKDIPDQEVNEQIVGGRLRPTTSFNAISDVDAVIICVPTPLTKYREPDISYILSAGKAIAPHLEEGQLVVLESTTYPGTTEEDLLSLLERESGLKAGQFLLAFSPEREDPGNKSFKTGNIPKVVGGYDEASSRAAQCLYSRAGIAVIPVSSCKTAEATKLLENIFRCVNIALVNELKVVFDKMGIDIWEVINAAKTKPFGFMPFYPGPGLGGHCIPIDPFYLTWKAREFGTNTKFIELAGEINQAMPSYVVSRLTTALNDRQKKALKGAIVLLAGIAYKKDVEDIRESPSFAVWEMLQKAGAEVWYHDPHVPEIPQCPEHPSFVGAKSLPFSSVSNIAFDAVVILTDHSNVDYEKICASAKLIVDTRNACKSVSKEHQFKIIKA